VPRFEDQTSSAGLDGVSASYVNWLDADGDGGVDLLVNGNRLFRNTCADTIGFEEVSSAAGLGSAKRGPALCVDMDNDGDTDILSTRGHLWRNDGAGRFSDVAAAAGFRPHAKSNVIGCGDVDGDGFVDFYIGMKEDWNAGKPVYYPHELWLSHEGTALEEVGREAGIDIRRYARSVLFADVDGDGLSDIFVGNYRLQANVLWRNLGGVRFEDRAKGLGVQGRYQPGKFQDSVARGSYGPRYGHTIGACWLDIDNDGSLDLFTANLVHKYVGPSSRETLRYDIRGYVCDDSAIYRRSGKRFEDWRDRLGVPRRPIGGPGVYEGDELWAGCTPGDVNNDGWEDVFVPQIYNLPYARSVLLLNGCGQVFEDAAVQAGIRRIDTYAGALADVDGDGLVDVATAGRPRKGAAPSLCLYRNTGSGEIAGLAWVKVRVAPGGSRQTVIGTTVKVYAGDLVQTRLVSAGSSTYGQQNEPDLHFGLGALSGGVRIQVTWPSGRTDASAVRPGSRTVFRLSSEHDSFERTAL